HTRFSRDWSSDVCSSDLGRQGGRRAGAGGRRPARDGGLPGRAGPGEGRGGARAPRRLRGAAPARHRSPPGRRRLGRGRAALHRPRKAGRMDGQPRLRRRGGLAARRARGRHPPTEGGAGVSGSADRLPRLLALLPILMSHPGAQVGEVAEVFGLTEKQLIDDLQLVWMCGLPGHTPGDLIDVSWDGGEILIDNADTIARPLRLGIDEASALLVALRMLAATPELAPHDGDALPRVVAKLERAAGEGAAAVSSQVAVDVDAAPDALPRVREA